MLGIGERQKEAIRPNFNKSFFVGNGAKVELAVNLARDKEYILWGRVIAPSGGDNSFFIEIDNGGNHSWDIETG